MNLKQQTVYIPDDKKATGVYHSSQESIPVRKYTDQICLSKEEFVELLGNAFLAGYVSYDDDDKPDSIEYINKLLNNGQ